MRIAVLANDDQWKALLQAVNPELLYRVNGVAAISEGTSACIILEEIAPVDIPQLSIPILLNAVSYTLDEISKPVNIIRFNAWPGFLNHDTWEVAGLITPEIREVFQAMGKRVIAVPDQPGFVSARVIAMIVNEAFFALSDEVSNREDIDLAMKLGTGYPYGPFEWADRIGTSRILALLERLSSTDSRYAPAPMLQANEG